MPGWSVMWGIGSKTGSSRGDGGEVSRYRASLWPRTDLEYLQDTHNKKLFVFLPASRSFMKGLSFTARTHGYVDINTYFNASRIDEKNIRPKSANFLSTCISSRLGGGSNSLN